MRHSIDLRVRYSETDQMGVVYHANYFPWFEEARTALFDEIGFSYAALEEQGLMLPLTECGCKYRCPARYGDRVVIEATLAEFKGVQVTLQYRATRKADGKLLAEGFTRHAFVDAALHTVNLRRLRPDVYEKMMASVENNLET